MCMLTYANLDACLIRVSHLGLSELPVKDLESFKFTHSIDTLSLSLCCLTTFNSLPFTYFIMFPLISIAHVNALAHAHPLFL